MNEKPEALEVAAALRQRIAKLPSWDSTRTLLVCDDAARCIEKLHAEIERLKAENEALRRDAERYERVRKWICEILRVSDEVEFDAAMDASTAPAAAAVDASTAPATGDKT